MPRPPTASTALATEHLAFIGGGVSITAGSCDRQRQPSMARAIGCELSADGQRLRLLFCPQRAQALLADVAASGRIAVAYSQPSTHRTLQLKGRDGRVEPALAGDAALLERYAQAFVAELAPMNFPEAMVRVLLQVLAAAPVAVSFTLDAAFSQTPGPGAGARLP
ncbi:MAG: hypothetical protein Q8Q73_13470 [Stagnimonas sp.]|nr:hypothetical protein [Stagnimonas sp.]